MGKRKAVSFGLVALAMNSSVGCSTKVPDRTCESPAACKKECDTGSSGACTRIARWEIVGQGTPHDLKAGVALLERACASDEATACVSLSGHYRSGIGVTRDKKKADELAEKAIRRYEAECKAGGADSCFALARARESGPPKFRDSATVAALDKRTIELTRPACSKKIVSACRLLDSVVSGLPNRGANSPESMTMLDEACTGGAALACNTRANQFLNGTGIPQDDAKAAEYFKRAIDLMSRLCDAGVADRCVALGSIQSAARKVVKPAPDPSAAYIKACDLGDPVGCAYAGPAIGKELNERPADAIRGNELEKRSIALYSAACDEGWAGACIDVVQRILYRIAGDRAIAQEHIQYFDAYKRGMVLLAEDCAADDVNACRALGDDYGTKDKFGDKIPADPAKAKTFYERACALGDDFGCRKSRVIAVPAASSSAPLIEVPVPQQVGSARLPYTNTPSATPAPSR